MPPLTLTCQKCGLPMPDIDLESEEGKALLKALSSSTGFELKHDECPPDRLRREAAALEQSAVRRRFMAKVAIVEVIDAGDGQLREEPLVKLDVEAENVSFVEAVRPLALALGAKWQAMEEHAALVDVPTVEPTIVTEPRPEQLDPNAVTGVGTEAGGFIATSEDREPEPSDGPEFHADHEAWEARQEGTEQ